MSRIYQGGQSQGNYKAKERKQKYAPTTVLSQKQAILDEGKKDLDNLKTIDREARRADQMSDLEQQSADKVATTVLKDQLDQAARELKLEQQVETANQKIGEILATNDLKVAQTTEKGKVSIEQLTDKNSLEYKGIVEKNTLELEQLKETNILKSEHAAQRSDNNLALQHQQLSANVDSANFGVVKTAINGLISFGTTYAQEVAKAIDVREAEEEKTQVSIDNMPSGINVDNTVNSVITDDIQIDAENRAREEGIQATASSITEAQQLRAPSLKVETVRNLSKADIRSKGNLYPSRLNDALSDPNTQIPYKGQSLSLQQLIQTADSEEDIYNAIADIGAYLGNVDKPSVSDGAEALRAYGNQARMAISNAQSRYGAMYRSFSESNNYDSGKTLTATRMASGDHQGAWNAMNQASITSGKFIKSSPRDRQTQALKDQLELGDVDDARAMLNVLKDPSNSGSSFGDDKFYRPIIEKAIADKLRASDSLGRATSNLKEGQVDEVMESLTQQLRETTDPQLTLQLREEATDYLRQNFPGNVYAQEQIDSLTAAGMQSKTLELSIQEDLNNGLTPSMDQVLDWERTNQLDPKFITKLKKDVKLQDEVTIEMKAAGLGNIESSLKTIVGKYEGQIRQGGITDGGDVKATVAITARQLAPKVEQEMRTFVAQLPKDLPQSEKDRLITGKYEKLMNGITDVLKNENVDQLAFNESGFKFGLLGEGYGSIPKTGRINPITGQMSFAYVDKAITDLPPGAGTEDLILGTTDFAADAEVWNQGGSSYSARTIEAAKRLNVTPKAFVEAQAVARGYDNIHDGISSNAVIDFSSPQTTYSSFQAAGLTKNAAVQFGDRVSTMAPNALDDAIESNPVRLEKAEEFLGGSFASASPQRKLEAVMNDIKSFDRNSYRILRSPRSTDIQINRSIDEYFKGQQPITFPVVDTRISTGNSTAFQSRGVSTQTFLSANVPGGYGQTIAASAAKHGIDPGIMAGLLHQESGYSPDVINGTRVSSAGAQGIAQIMTEYHPGVNPLNPTEAIDYGASYLARLLKRYNGDYRLALTAYNAGEGNVDRYGGPIPGNKESEEYAQLVMQHARTYGWGQ